MRFIAMAGVIALSLACALPSSARAQEGSGDEQAQAKPEKGESPAESRSAEFEAVEGAPPGQDVPGGPLLVGAYGVAWLLLLLFVLRMGRLHAKTMRDVERLERTLDRGEGSGDEGDNR